MGENNLVNMGNKLGISSKLEAVPSLALGTSETSMIEMEEAYSSFANMGYKVESHFIDKIEDKDGNILYKFNNDKYRILNSSLAYILSDMLTFTYDKDFIKYNYPTLISLLPKITKKYAVKSGTTNTDMWIIGYNKKCVLSIWNGYDNNKIINNGDKGYHKNIWIDKNTSDLYWKKEYINQDNSFRDIPELRHKFVIDVRVFTLKNLHSADAQKRQHRYRENNNSDSA